MPDVDEDVKGTIRIEVGGVAHRVRVLPISAADRWIEQLEAEFDRIAGDVDAHEGGSLLGLTAKTNRAAARMVAAYDREGTLGGYDAILDTAFPSELAEAMEVMRTSALPFGRGILTMLDVFRMAAERRARERVEASDSTSPTSGPSTTGDSPRDLSKRRSATRSSTGSGRRGSGGPLASAGSA